MFGGMVPPCTSPLGTDSDGSGGEVVEGTAIMEF